MIAGGSYGLRESRNPVCVLLNAFCYEIFGLIRGLEDKAPLQQSSKLVPEY